MHLSLHKKAYRDILLIANGHEVYKNDLSKLAQNIYHIDVYSDDENYLNSLDSFKNYVNNNNLLDRETKIVYASGLEGKKDIQHYIENNFDVFGIPLTQFDEISNLNKINNTLLKGKINIPEISDTFNYKSLSKSYNSSGGIDVGNNIFSSNTYFQKFIPGKTFSISFIASDSDPFILGFNQLFSVENNTKYPFLHAGAMSIDFDQPYKGYMLDWIKVITKCFSLTGYISIDFKIFNNKLEILDINPRLSSSYRLYTRKYKNLIANHMMPGRPLDIKSNDYFAYIILYAKNDFVVDKCIGFIEDVSDTPNIGQVIKKDMPIMTLNIRANNQYNLYKEIKRRIISAMKIIDCYNTQLDYEQY